MGESKHTLGPWEVVRHGDDGRPNPEGGTYWVMPVAGHGSGWVGDDSYLSVCVGSGPDAPANARLIAAAPEMKEALKEARTTLSITRTNIMVEMKRSEGAAYRFESVPEILKTRIEAIDAVLAKAIGEDAK